MGSCCGKPPAQLSVYPVQINHGAKMIDPKREKHASRILESLPVVTPAMKKAQVEYTSQKVNVEQFLEVCDEELQRIKDAENPPNTWPYKPR
jgi:hypothetical protein